MISPPYLIKFKTEKIYHKIHSNNKIILDVFIPD